jgi:pimeloyl-ACP methyl ester carboxylesterase
MEAIAVKSATLAGGLSLPYAETGDPSGFPVVLVHAYVESWKYFDALLRHLPASIHAYAPTQRGHGDADQPSEGYAPEDFAADIVAFMDVTGINRALLLGCSSGGLVAQIVASAYPDRVSGLALISSPATLADKPGVLAMYEEIVVLSDPLDHGFVEGFVRNTSPESVPPDFVTLLVAESLKAPARVWKETLRGLIEAELPVALARITAPTLLIAGDQDAFVLGDQQILLQGIPEARLLLYSQVGHAVHLAHPRRVVDDLVTFLERHFADTTNHRS